LGEGLVSHVSSSHFFLSSEYQISLFIQLKKCIAKGNICSTNPKKAVASHFQVLVTWCGTSEKRSGL
jgi:hypothetical protein